MCSIVNADFSVERFSKQKHHRPNRSRIQQGEPTRRTGKTEPLSGFGVFVDWDPG
jgi:hypothetical protein